MRFPNQAGATVQSITGDILKKQFVVVKHSWEHREKSRSKAAKARKASASDHISQKRKDKENSKTQRKRATNKKEKVNK